MGVGLRVSARGAPNRHPRSNDIQNDVPHNGGGQEPDQAAGVGTTVYDQGIGRAFVPLDQTGNRPIHPLGRPCVVFVPK